MQLFLGLFPSVRLFFLECNNFDIGPYFNCNNFNNRPIMVIIAHSNYNNSSDFISDMILVMFCMSVLGVDN